MITIAIDCGASFVKAGLLIDGSISREIRLSTPEVAKEISTPNQIKEIEKLVRTAYTQLSKDFSEIYVSFANEMHGFVLCDDQGNPITDYISWQKEFGNKSIAEPFVTPLDVLRDKALVCDIANTGMPIRSGLPSSNLMYILNHGINKDLFPKIRFFTLGDYLIFRLFGVITEIHPTNAAATGMYDLSKGVWNNRIIDVVGASKILFQQVGAKESMVKTGDKIIHIFPSIGDQQAALYGAGLKDDKGISFNLGTGAQVSIVSNNMILSDDFQTRPYFENKYILTIPHIPSGRALNVYVRFLKNVVETLGFEMKEDEIWSRVLNKITENSFKTHLDCDLSFFENAITKYTCGCISNIEEYDLSVDKLFAKAMEKIANNAIIAADRIVCDCDMYRYLVFSGGVSTRLNHIRDAIVRHYPRISDIIIAEKETLLGVYKYICSSCKEKRC